LGSTITFTATVTNLANTQVTWQVNGVAGGNGTVGKITSAGVYTPPAIIPATNAVTVTAVSVASPSVSGSAPVSILNPIPSVSAAGATPVSGTSYTLEVDGAGFVSGAEIQAGTANVTTTFVSSTELQATVTIPTGTTSLSVSVMNPSPGAAASNAVNAAIYVTTVATAARLLDQSTFGPSLATIRQVQSTRPTLRSRISHRHCRLCACPRTRPPTAKSLNGGKRCSPVPTNCGSAWHLH
jgi:hypothetical protein